MNDTTTTQPKPIAVTPQPQAAAPAIDSGAFKKAVTWAAQNPDAPQARELQTRIVGGKYNDTIKSMGLDPVQFGYKAPPVAPVPAPTQNPIAKAAGAVGGFLNDAGENAQKEVATGFMEAFRKAKEDFSAGTVAGGVHGVADVIQGAFTPLSATFNALTGGLIPKMTEEIGKGTADIPAVEKVLNKVNDFFDKHPDAKRFILEDMPAFINAGAVGVGAGNPGEVSGAMTSMAEKAAPVVNKVVGAVKTGAETIVDTAGKVTDAAGGVVDNLKSGMQSKAVDKLEADYSKWTGQTKTGVKNMGKAETKTKALDKAGTTGRPPQRVLAEAGIIPETQGTKFSTFNQANQVREGVRPLNEANTDALRAIDSSVPPSPIDQLEAKTINSIRTVRKPAGEIESMVADARKEFALLRQKHGDAIKPSDLNEEKINYSGGVKFDASRPLQNDVNYQIRKTLQSSVEEKAAESGNEAVAQLNREIGDRLGAADFLQTLDGQTLKYGKIGKYAFMGIGATLGHGILGKVLGALGGEMVADILMKADVAGPVKRILLKSIEQKSPEAYNATIEWMRQNGLDKDLQLALPPAGGSSAPIIPPAPTTFEAPAQSIDRQFLPPSSKTPLLNAAGKNPILLKGARTP